MLLKPLGFNPLIQHRFNMPSENEPEDQQSKRSSAVSGALDTSLALERSQTAPQAQAQQSHLTLSRGFSSQNGPMSQFSQNSQDDILTNEKVGSQEKENSLRRTTCLPPICSTREDSQLMLSRTSNNVMHRWSNQEYKGQTSDELEHRIGMIETSLTRLGMILDSVQVDVMQVNKGTKEVALELEGVQQKLVVHDDSLQSVSKGQEDIKTHMDIGFKSLAGQLRQITKQENYGEIISKLSTVSEELDNKMVKLCNDIYKDFHEEIQAISCSINIFKQKQATPQVQGPKLPIFPSPQEIQFPNKHTSTKETCLLPKIETGGWTSVKQDLTTYKFRTLNKRSNRIIASPNPLECRVVSDSEEEIGFSCLLKEKGTERDEYSIEEAKEETARILRKARRRKRKYCNTIVLN